MLLVSIYKNLKKKVKKTFGELEHQDLKDALKFFGKYTGHIEIYWNNGAKEQVTFCRPTYSLKLDTLIKKKFYEKIDRSSNKSKVRTL
jgi:hypothetical protein